MKLRLVLQAIHDEPIPDPAGKAYSAAEAVRRAKESIAERVQLYRVKPPPMPTKAQRQTIFAPKYPAPGQVQPPLA